LKNSSFFVRLDVERTHFNQKIQIFENPTSACQTTVHLCAFPAFIFLLNGFEEVIFVAELWQLHHFSFVQRFFSIGGIVKK
jgi:hypothetical protein